MSQSGGQKYGRDRCGGTDFRIFLQCAVNATRAQHKRDRLRFTSDVTDAGRWPSHYCRLPHQSVVHLSGPCVTS
jgi:hypothetical protein